MLVSKMLILCKVFIVIVLCHLLHIILHYHYYLIPFLWYVLLLVIGILRSTIVLIIFHHHMQEGEDLQKLGIEGDEDYELVPQYDYNNAILDGQNEYV